MAVLPIPKHNPDDMHLNLMSCDFGCQDSVDIADAVIDCVNHNSYQTDPVYLVQCLVELFHPTVVERVKAHFGL